MQIDFVKVLGSDHVALYVNGSLELEFHWESAEKLSLPDAVSIGFHETDHSEFTEDLTELVLADDEGWDDISEED